MRQLILPVVKFSILLLLDLSIQGSSDDGVWLALARAEVKAWERDPAVGHHHLRMACDAHRRSIDLLKTGFAEV